ncbi:DNA internalization-related competence protein ComEC/Rec2 [Carnimonas nigrificans]|uniref:DNA internalization-related competence protein ComEC/Rec2 n=1 Tax=Carnimonas nigrificans TaxID=64323 RepID=UPI0004729965|nr:DNA internalization-related competence protein ComEC/Rec2 [Carnimonas nigrificans]
MSLYFHGGGLALGVVALIVGIGLGALPHAAHWLSQGVGVLCIACVLLLAWRKWLALLMLVALLVGWVNMLHALDHRLPLGLARQPLVLAGRIEQVSLGEQGNVSLVMKVERCRPQQRAMPSCDQLRRVRLGWFSPQPVAVGERWQFGVRLIPAHSRSNSGGGVGNARMLSQALGATGSVQRSPAPQKLSAARLSLRSSVAGRIAPFIENSPAERWAHALLLGDASLFNDSDWQRLNDSGTVHLVVVSGMHVGILMVCLMWLSRRLLKVLAPRHWHIQRWPWLVALALAGGYVMLSGSGPPAVRAWLMAVVMVWYVSSHYAPPPFSGWWLALGALLLGDPLLVFRPGLWFSFMAVAALLLAWRWRPTPSRWYGLLRTQLTLGLLLDGAVLLVFGRWMPVSLLANLVAIPWVSSVMLPLGLIALVVALAPGQCGAGLFWQLFDWATLAYEWWLSLLTTPLPAVPLAWERRLPIAVAMMLAALLWLLPGFSRRFRLMLTAALLPLLAGSSGQRAIVPGDVVIRVEDIGQGQLLDIRTRHHRMLYDTGPRSFSGYMPLSELWPPGQHFDMLLLSHADLDHSGGVAALHELHQVDQWLAPDSTTFGLPVQTVDQLNVVACRAGQQWQWDGVLFTILWPLPGMPLPDDENHRSCVLLIEAHQKRALILGDAPKAVEYHLLSRLDRPLALLISGHHGSKTSSSYSLLVRARPRHVIHSYGFFNAYHHPAEEVIRRTDHHAACQWGTAEDGTLEARISLQGIRVLPLRRHRAVERSCVEVSSAL